MTGGGPRAAGPGRPTAVRGPGRARVVTGVGAAVVVAGVVLAPTGRSSPVDGAACGGSSPCPVGDPHWWPVAAGAVLLLVGQVLRWRALPRTPWTVPGDTVRAVTCAVLAAVGGALSAVAFGVGALLASLVGIPAGAAVLLLAWLVQGRSATELSTVRGTPLPRSGWLAGRAASLLAIVLTGSVVLLVGRSGDLGPPAWVVALHAAVLATAILVPQLVAADRRAALAPLVATGLGAVAALVAVGVLRG